jgi:hypothetical protein
MKKIIKTIIRIITKILINTINHKNQMIIKITIKIANKNNKMKPMSANIAEQEEETNGIE